MPHPGWLAGLLTRLEPAEAFDEDITELRQQFYVTLRSYFARIQSNGPPRSEEAFTRVQALLDPERPQQRWSDCYEVEQLMVHLFDDEMLQTELRVRLLEAQSDLRPQQADFDKTEAAKAESDRVAGEKSPGDRAAADRAGGVPARERAPRATRQRSPVALHAERSEATIHQVVDDTDVLYLRLHPRGVCGACLPQVPVPCECWAWRSQAPVRRHGRRRPGRRLQHADGPQRTGRGQRALRPQPNARLHDARVARPHRRRRGIHFVLLPAVGTPFGQGVSRARGASAGPGQVCCRHQFNRAACRARTSRSRSPVRKRPAVPHVHGHLAARRLVFHRRFLGKARTRSAGPDGGARRLAARPGSDRLRPTESSRSSTPATGDTGKKEQAGTQTNGEKSSSG